MGSVSMVENTLYRSLFHKNASSMVSPAIDFLMAGGLTLIFFPLALLPIWKGSLGLYAAVLAFSLNFVLNYPHFMHGYQLLYKNYSKKILDPAKPLASRVRHIVSGIIAPLFLVLFIIYGVFQPTAGPLGYCSNIMFFFIGWHYAKQGYGILMTFSAKRKVYYSSLEKKVLLINTYLVWFISWIHFNAVYGPRVAEYIPYHPLAVTMPQDLVAKDILLLWTFFLIFFIIKRSDKHSSISVIGWTGYISALYPWLLFMQISPLSVAFVPALHSLQYLFFVWKMEYEKTRARLKKLGVNAESATRHIVFRHMFPFIAIGIGLGVLCLYLIPTQLDAHIHYNAFIFGPGLFSFCFFMFLNIHHYFIDFAIWRRDNPDMKFLFE
jgi:hypothetical protein